MFHIAALPSLCVLVSYNVSAYFMLVTFSAAFNRGRTAQRMDTLLSLMLVGRCLVAVVCQGRRAEDGESFPVELLGQDRQRADDQGSAAHVAGPRRTFTAQHRTSPSRRSLPVCPSVLLVLSLQAFQQLYALPPVLAGVRGVVF